MSNENFIKGNTEEEIWLKIEEQFEKNPDPLNYTAIIEQDDVRVVLSIDIDLGGGFESGYETTSFTAPTNVSDFKFAIHPEHFTDEIGKFFGMQDVVLGYEEFDRKLIIKTNDETKVKFVFADESVRTFFQSLDNFSLAITHHHSNDSDKKETFLELVIESGITDVSTLRRIYKSFCAVLKGVNNFY